MDDGLPAPEIPAVPSAARLPVTVVIPTRNEERNLPATLGTLGAFAEVVVFDSHSTDGTEQIAREWGARFHQRVFDNFADHKNWALDNLEFRTDWVLLLDADERIGPDLLVEIAAAIHGDRPEVAFAIPRRNVVDGVFLRRAGMYPDYQIRLIRRGRARYERRLVHEHMLADGPVGFLASPLRHEDGKGIRRYLERHVAYAEMEAVEAFIDLHRPAADLGAHALPGPMARRRRLKHWSYRHLPLRFLWVFAYVYVARLGLLMGRTGLKYCLLRAFYEFKVDLFLAELRNGASPVAQTYRDLILERLGRCPPDWERR